MSGARRGDSDGCSGSEEPLEGHLAWSWGLTSPPIVPISDRHTIVARWQFRSCASLHRHLAVVVPTRWSGTRNWDETVEGYLRFSDQWLSKHGLEPRHCRVARAGGTSMQPTLADRCLIRVDLRSKEFRDGAVFVASTIDGVVARRAAKFSDGRRLASDDGQSAPVRWQGSNVIGEVRWMRRTR